MYKRGVSVVNSVQLRRRLDMLNDPSMVQDDGQGSEDSRARASASRHFCRMHPLAYENITIISFSILKAMASAGTMARPPHVIVGRRPSVRLPSVGIRRKFACHAKTESVYGFDVPLELEEWMKDTSDLDAINGETIPPWEEIWGDLDSPENQRLYRIFDKYVSEYTSPVVVGDTVIGEVVHVGREGAYVEIGDKATAHISPEDASAAKVTHVSS